MIITITSSLSWLSFFDIEPAQCHDQDEDDQDEDDGGTDGMKVSCVALKKRLFSVVTVQHASGDLQDSWSFSNSISIQSRSHVEL